MTVDERLERLVERHEALAQTVEMLTLDIREMAEENKKLDGRLDKLVEGIEGLLQIAQIHGQRLTDIEGRQG